MPTMSDRFRDWYEHERDCNVKTVKMLRSVDSAKHGTAEYRRALDLLGRYDDLTQLGLELGFSSHSHFSSAFRQAYDRTPAEFQRFAGLR